MKPDCTGESTWPHGSDERHQEIVLALAGLTMTLICTTAFAQIPFADNATTESDTEFVSKPNTGTIEKSDEPSDTLPVSSSSPSAAWFLECTLTGRVNPLGLTLSAESGYRIPLHDSQHVLLRGSYLDLGVTTAVSPAYVRGGGQVELAPLSVLVLDVSIQRLFYFGTFGYIHEFDALDADWNPGRLSEIEDAGLGESTGGTLVEAGATLQAMFGRWVMFIDSEVSWVWMDVAAPYYEPYFDFLMAPDDAVWSLEALVGYLIREEWLLGGWWEHTGSREGRFQRDVTGLVVNWELPHTWGVWGQPSIYGLIGIYANDPHRSIEPLGGVEISIRF